MDPFATEDIIETLVKLERSLGLDSSKVCYEFPDFDGCITIM